MTLLLDDATVQAVFDWKTAISALRDAYACSPAPEFHSPRGLRDR